MSGAGPGAPPSPTDPPRSVPALIAIAAVGPNGVIGRDGTLPWRLPEELRWFKEATLGQAVLMGRKTFASLRRPLPDRLNLVVTCSGQLPPAPGRDRRETATTTEAAAGAGSAARVELVADLAAFRPEAYPVATVFVAGGEEIYRQMLPRCAELWLSHVTLDVAGDTFFPAYADRFAPREVLRRGAAFTARRYVAG